MTTKPPPAEVRYIVLMSGLLDPSESRHHDFPRFPSDWTTFPSLPLARQRADRERAFYSSVQIVRAETIPATTDQP